MNVSVRTRLRACCDAAREALRGHFLLGGHQRRQARDWVEFCDPALKPIPISSLDGARHRIRARRTIRAAVTWRRLVG